jgi:hypothetical protein
MKKRKPVSGRADKLFFQSSFQSAFSKFNLAGVVAERLNWAGFSGTLGRTRDVRAYLRMWRQASLPAVEGGILPPGKNRPDGETP